MAGSRRKHSAEFKREAVRLTREPGRTVGEVAASLGIDRSLLQRWRSAIEAHGAEAFPGNGRPKASDEEVIQLRKDLARAQQERDILKKALAYFAKERS
jgi:transposase